MAVSNGQVANQETFNNAFPSKTVNDEVPVKWDLKNTELESGDEVINLQKTINEASVKIYAVEQLAAGSDISIDNVKGLQLRRIISDGGDVTLSLTPFGTNGGWADGTRVQLIGGHDTNRCRINHNDVDYGAILNGDMQFNKWDSITLIWIEDELRWLELGRNT